MTRDTLELARDAGLEAGTRSGFTACLGPRTSATIGETLTLAVDPSALHFFDAETEVALA